MLFNARPQNFLQRSSLTSSLARNASGVYSCPHSDIMIDRQALRRRRGFRYCEPIGRLYTISTNTLKKNFLFSLILSLSADRYTSQHNYRPAPSRIIHAHTNCRPKLLYFDLLKIYCPKSHTTSHTASQMSCRLSTFTVRQHKLAMQMPVS